MTMHSKHDLSKAVAAICPDIQSRTSSADMPTERHLWWELSACILSSQVPYVTAAAAADAIDGTGLLMKPTHNYEHLFEEIEKILTSPLTISGCKRMYRFPSIRAHQLAKARVAVQPTLQKRLSNIGDAYDARAWLVKHIPGIGPKQASMFLRNIGTSYDLAILDRHVLNYMAAVGIHPEDRPTITNLRHYYLYEAKLRAHAAELECKVGLLDWAIWIVMRAAKQLG